MWLVTCIYIRLTTKGALGDDGSLDIGEDDDEDWPFLKSLQHPACFSLL